MSKKIRSFVIILGVLVVVVGLCAGLGYYYILAPNTSVKDDGIIYLRDNSSISQVLDTLRRHGYIENAYTPSAVAKLKRFASPVKSGRYKIRNGMNNNELINMFRSGNQYPVYFTFNNMRTLDEFVEEAHEKLGTSKEELLTLLKDSDVLADLGFDSTTIMAMFIPNTYQIYWNTPALDLLKRMKKEYHRFWNEDRMAKASAIGLSPEEVITLALYYRRRDRETRRIPCHRRSLHQSAEPGNQIGCLPDIEIRVGRFHDKPYSRSLFEDRFTL